MSSKTKIKDKSANPIQISAEQLIREAKERDLERIIPVEYKLVVVQQKAKQSSKLTIIPFSISNLGSKTKDLRSRRARQLSTEET